MRTKTAVTHTQSGVKTEDRIKKHKDMKQMRLKEQADERKMEGVNNKRMKEGMKCVNVIKYEKRRM